MAIVSRYRLLLAAALLVSPLGCRGQAVSTTADGRPSADLARRIEVLIRSRGNVPPTYAMSIGPMVASNVPGFKQVSVKFTGEDGTASKPVNFLISDDGKTLAQFSQYDISEDPKLAISDAGRPSRGGPESAPVTIVGFDDLECPFCARLHAQMFPALEQRYGKSVHFVYRDYPLPNHPWAMRAAVDVNCLAAQSAEGYWKLVDHIHAHAAELGGQENSIDVANRTLDTLTLDEGKAEHVDGAKLAACVAKQDKSGVEASVKVGDALGLGSTPVLFINGEKFEGAYPTPEYLYRMIDGALVAAGRTPPPPAVPVAPPPTAAGGETAQPPASRPAS